MKRIILCLLLAFATSSHAETVNPGDMTKPLSPDQAVMKMKDIHDIAALMPAQGIPGWAVVAASMAAAAVVAVAAFLVWKKFRRGSEEAVAIPVLPWVEAYKRLDGLSGSLDRCSEREFYFSLSEIMRRYVSRRFEIDAMEMTAEELKPMIDSMVAAFPDKVQDLRAGMRSFVNRSELVKFGKDEIEMAGTEKMKEDMAFIRLFVGSTIPSIENEVSSVNEAGLPKQAANGLS